MTSAQDWYRINNAESIDSPALIVYRDRVLSNIRALIKNVKSVSSLRPHVKTHKMREVCAMMLREGITKFKCATIAEAEMLGAAGATDVLLAYQPVGPKTGRLLQLVQTFRQTKFSCVFDSAAAANDISSRFHSANEQIGLFIDLNVGMNRTGVAPEKVPSLVASAGGLPGIFLEGIHAYDGQIADDDAAVRTAQCEKVIGTIRSVLAAMPPAVRSRMTVVAGGSPTYVVHAQQEGFECSPGTFVFWDWSYSQMMPEEPFDYAALVMTRVISVVDDRTICTDLGHKSVAAEKPPPRVLFLNAPEAIPVSHSEEHLVLSVPDVSRFPVGTVLYGVPKHICPTVALYERATVVENHRAVSEWEVTARNKIISI